jgi:subtilisin-like proprotein convertase family protein
MRPGRLELVLRWTGLLILAGLIGLQIKGQSGGGNITQLSGASSSLTTGTYSPIQTWRNGYFGNPLSTGAGANEGNPSGDGIPNLLKYALGLNPLAYANLDQSIVAGTFSSNGLSYLSLTVNRSAPAPDVVYLIEVSSDGTNWVSGAANTITLASTATQVVVRDKTPLASGPRFVRLNVIPFPEIVTQPSDQTNVAGAAVTFGVAADGGSDLGYQWFKNATIRLANGGNVSGATSSNLSLVNLGAADAATYSVTVSNSAGAVTSAPVVLSVILPPAIVSQPLGQTNNATTTANFAVVANGGNLVYHWLKDETNRLSDGGRISGATTPGLSVSGLTPADAGAYSVTVSNAAGTITSSAAVLVVKTDGTGSGMGTYFSSTNSGGITIPDSGKANPYPAGIAVTGVTGVVSQVSVTLKQLSHTYIHDVNVLLVAPSGPSVLLFSHIGGTLGVTNISLNLDDAANNTLPASGQVVSGTFRPSSGGGTGTFPSPAPAGPYSTTLSAFAGAPPNGTWSLYVWDDSANDRGSIAGGWGLTLTSTNTPPSITTPPLSQTALAGTSVGFSVGATGDAPLAYQWRFHGTNLLNIGQISGASSSVLTLTGVQSGNAGPYTVLVSNPFGVTTSSVANLTVTVPTLAQLTNLPASAVQASTATLNGQVTSTGNDVPTVTLYYGPTDGGSTPGAWAQSLTLGPASGVFATTVSGLFSNAIYFYTHRAVNAAGASWAAPSASFTTLRTNTGPAPVAVLKHRYDPANTGANLSETILTAANVNTNQFGLLYSRAVDDQIYAQPLIMTNVSLPGKGTHNLLLVATVNDSVYAFDADDASVTSPYWKRSFLSPNVVPPNSLDTLASPCGSFFNISGNFGIVGTPVIDPLTGTLYLVARTKEFGTNFVQRLHALDISTGNDRSNSPVIITATYPGTGTGSISGVLTFDPFKQNQRPALTLVNGVVYIGWASHCDWDPYHGWLIGYSATTLQRTCVFNTSPNGTEAGIWMSGAAPASDAQGNLYLSVGNGTVGSGGNPRNPINRGESYLKLTPSGSDLLLASWFTPNNWQYLEANDLDLGSAGVLLIPGTSLLLSGSKAGKAYLVNRDNMGGLSFSSSDTNIIQSFQVTALSGMNNIHGAPVWWDGPNSAYAYIQGESDYVRQYQFDRTDGIFLQPAYAQSPTTAPVGSMPGGFLSLSANGPTAGSAVLWASHPLSGNAQGEVRPGILRAYNAQNVGAELWNSEKVSVRDSVGNFSKYCPPVIANGKVYLATFSNRVNVYGLR